jgi:signal transduction histidine kinase
MRRHVTLDTAVVVAAVVMTAAALFEAGSGGPGAELTPLSVATALLTGLAVLVARWSPLGAVVLLAGVVAVPMLFVRDLPPSGGAQLIAWMLLVGNAAYRLPRRRGLGAYAVAALVPAVTIVVAGEAIWEFLFYGLILAPAWVVGVLLQREQRRSAELTALTEELRHEREKQAEVAVAAERTRISRELHDAVAHTVSVMTLQVGVVRRRLGTGTVEEETLRGAETLGRQAVDELRRIVGLVREGESAALAPLPSLTRIDELVAQVRGTGTPVALEVSGSLDDVPQAVGMSAYRIVQEGLTNALRHAPGAPVEVRVSVDATGVELTVDNGAARKPVHPTAAGGHGLVGIRERVHVIGGELSVGSTPDGGHRLRARLPLSSATVEVS